MSQFQIPVSHLFTLTLEGLSVDRFDFTGPLGRRIFEKASGGTFSGERLKGKVLALLNTDYGRASADGAIRALDAEVTLMTDDGTAILMSYRGRSSPSYGKHQQRLQVLFQVGAGPYDWLNGIQAIGVGRAENGRAVIEIYMLTGAQEAPSDGKPAGQGAACTALAAEYLFTRKSEHTPGAERHVVKGPLGARYLTLAEGGGAFKGPTLNGVFIPGYSWSPHRIGEQGGQPLLQFDVKTMLRTHDGVPILMSYTGANSSAYGTMAWMTAVLFEVPDGPYGWMNEIQAIGIGRWAGDGAEYKVYRLH